MLNFFTKNQVWYTKCKPYAYKKHIVHLRIYFLKRHFCFRYLNFLSSNQRSNQSIILSSNRAAGMGPSAHCKHIIVVLSALADYCLTKSLQMEETSTSKLQTFNQAKKYFSSPQKCSDLNLRKWPLSIKEFDPRLKKYQNKTNYDLYFRNVVLNSQTAKAPVRQLYAPAVKKAMFDDHDYLEKHPEEQFLKDEEIIEITTQRACTLLIESKEQSFSRTWREERRKRLTSSNFGQICKRTNKTNEEKLCRTFLMPRLIQAESLNHGKQYESVAINQYEQMTGYTVLSTGLWISTSHPFFASSPDSLIEPNGMIEVKCPFTAKDDKVTPKTVPYLEIQLETLMLKENHDYYFQVQGAHFCTQRSWCDFVVFTLKDLKIIKIPRNQLFIDVMVANLSQFFKDHFLKALLNHLLYKDEHIYNFNV